VESELGTRVGIVSFAASRCDAGCFREGELTAWPHKSEGRAITGIGACMVFGDGPELAHTSV
jgi:hypothetical protein